MNTLLRPIRRAATALLMLAAMQAGTAIAASSDSIQSHSADVNGVTLHYLEAGKGTGTPVVLLHGYAQTSHMWRPLMRQLADSHVVIAPDLRGAGTSSKPVGGYEKKNLAQDIHALVKAKGYPKVKIVGHDIGLMVAYAYAAQYPDEVESIVLMDAFLPGVGDWSKVWLLRDLWHFHFYGETPLKLVDGRERIYFELERLRRRPQPLRVRNRPPVLRRRVRPAERHARRLRVLQGLRAGCQGLRRTLADQAADADAGAHRREGLGPVPDRTGQAGGDERRRRGHHRFGPLADG
jgi:pimeloyl-ACP methyl ester carboxylesterase